MVSNGRVLLAADSLTLSETTPRTECKIKQSGSVFWAAAGLNTFGKTRFDLAKTIARVSRKHTHAEELLNIAGDEVLPVLQRSLPLVKKDIPWFYQRAIRDGYILSLLAVEDSGGIGVRVYAKDFPLSGDTITQKPAHQCSRPYECILYAAPNGMAAYIASHHHEVWDVDPITAIDTLMAVGQRMDPTTIGSPVSIVQFASAWNAFS